MGEDQDSIIQGDLERGYILALRSGNSKAILETISEIRKNGSVTILPDLFELMACTLDPEVMDATVKLVNDLKSEEVIPVMIDAIKDSNYLSIRKDLIASCWQSGLDYHTYLKVFINVAIEGDYASTLEAFTVIEDNAGQVDDKERTVCIKKLESAINTSSKEKLPLLLELVSILKGF